MNLGSGLRDLRDSVRNLFNLVCSKIIDTALRTKTVEMLTRPAYPRMTSDFSAPSTDDHHAARLLDDVMSSSHLHLKGIQIGTKEEQK